ncbi:ankyrin repeat-containing domain protein, partial [Baffinella frigidus]
MSAMLGGAGGEAGAERVRMAESIWEAHVQFEAEPQCSVTEALWGATGRGETEEVRRLIEGGADMKAKSGTGTKPLQFAALQGHEEVVRVLLDARADVSVVWMGATALDLALKNGHAGVARVLRGAGAAHQELLARIEKTLDLAKTQKERGNAEYKKLSYDTAAEHYSKALRLTELVKPPLPDEQDKATRALKLQCLMNRALALSKMGDHARAVLACADALSLDPDCEKALFRRALSNMELGVVSTATADLARVLEINPSNKEAQAAYDGIVCMAESLSRAAWEGEAEEARRLIAGGANVAATADDGTTHLHFASGGGHEDVVKVLLDAGVNVSPRDYAGATPLHLASKNGHEGVVKVLLDAGADVDPKVHEGFTPLHVAALNGHAGVVMVLLGAGADGSAKARHGMTALNFAGGCERVVRVLLDSGADFQAKDDRGRTALDLAVEYGHKGVERMLREAAQAASAAEALVGASSASVARQMLSGSAAERGEAVAERDRRLAEAYRDLPLVLQAAAVIKESSEGERARMLEGARMEVEEARRQGAAIQEAARESAARERETILEGARMEAAEARLEVAETRREAASLAAGRLEVAAEGERVFAAIEVGKKDAVEVGKREAAKVVEAAKIGLTADLTRIVSGRVLCELEAGRHVKVFFYGELEVATEGFSSDRRIGGGGFGNVFKALGLVGKGECAVKRLEEGSMQGQLEFLQEVQVLGGCCHKNLLPLRGFSADRASGGSGGAVCLVSPLMRGGSLEDRLFPLADGASARLALLGMPPQPAPLAWDVRLRIGAEIASALEYLHAEEPETHKPQVFHRDVKPANVLLDADLHVRLGDVGLARAQAGGGTHITFTQVAGTNGFLDPNYQTTGHFDALCDGFSLGVV